MFRLAVDGLSKMYGGKTVLDRVSFAVQEGQRVGIVGANGAGKSTLLRCLAGVEEPDEGSVSLTGRARLGYLPQEGEGGERGGEAETRGEGRTLWDAARAVLAPLEQMEERLRSLEERMAAGGAAPGRGDALTPATSGSLAVAEEYARLTAEFERLGGYNREVRVRQALFGLGFGTADLGLLAAGLSGGQRARLALARLLVEAPDLLLLDEPTNHLDLQALDWLEEFLRGYRGTAVLVSHDRFFLDAVVDTIVALEAGEAAVYRGNYSRYLQQREESLAREEAEYRRQREEIARLQAFIRRNRAGVLSRQAKSREKRLDRLELVDRPRRQARPMKARFAAAAITGEEVLRLEGLGKAYGSRVLFQDLSGRLERGDRLAVVGPNGAGKSTLLKILVGQASAGQGDWEWGEEVELGYFAQERDDLVPEHTLLQSLLAATDLTNEEARTVLGRFLFRQEDVFKRVGELSGGERSRLALARLAVGQANVLLLDEPTNHLDLPSRGALEEALADFPGAMVIVSHDRYLLDRLATRVLEIEGGRAEWYQGNWTAYRRQKQEPSPSAVPASSGRAAFTERRARRAAERASRGAQARLAEIEARIEELERRKAELEARMDDPGLYRGEQGREAVDEYRRVEAELRESYAAWETAAEEAAARAATVEAAPGKEATTEGGSDGA